MTIFNIELDKHGNEKRVTKEVRFVGDKGEVLLETQLVYNTRRKKFNLTTKDRLALSSRLLKRQVISNSKNRTVIDTATLNAAIQAVLKRDLVQGVKAFVGTYTALVGVYSIAGLTVEIMLEDEF